VELRPTKPNPKNLNPTRVLGFEFVVNKLYTTYSPQTRKNLCKSLFFNFIYFLKKSLSDLFKEINDSRTLPLRTLERFADLYTKAIGSGSLGFGAFGQGEGFTLFHTLFHLIAFILIVFVLIVFV